MTEQPQLWTMNMSSPPQRTTKQRYSKVPEIAGSIIASPIDENSDHEYDREHGFGDDDNNSFEFTNNPSLSADVKRSLYVSERVSSKEIKYLQDERFRDENHDDDTTFSEETSQHHHYILLKIHRILTTNLVNVKLSYRYIDAFVVLKMALRSMMEV